MKSHGVWEKKLFHTEKYEFSDSLEAFKLILLST